MKCFIYLIMNYVLIVIKKYKEIINSENFQNILFGSLYQEKLAANKYMRLGLRAKCVHQMSGHILKTKYTVCIVCIVMYKYILL